MNDRFRMWVGISAVAGGILALLSLVVGVAGVDYDFEVFSDTSSLIASGARAADFIRWSYWMNMLGNYLLLIPLALVLHAGSKKSDVGPSQVYLAGGLVYITLGAAGSAILASAWPYLIDAYETASATEQQTLVTQFEVVNTIAEEGLHGVIQNLAGAVWFLGMGSLLRPKRNRLGVLALVIGAFLVLNTLGNMFDVEALSVIGLSANILLGPLWSILIGIEFWKRSFDPAPAEDRTTAVKSDLDSEQAGRGSVARLKGI